MLPVTSPSAAIDTDRQKLHAIGQKVVDGCPDMREMARNAAADILRAHGLSDLEPDTVYWHRFNRTESSPLTFNGWEHLDTPVESLTLPQLVMRRFNANDQDNADDLQAMSGFYTDGPKEQAYDEANEVRLLPQDVMEAFWTLDFKTRFNTQLTAFWQHCADDFRTLSKANFIAKAVEDHGSAVLDSEQFTSLLEAVGIDLKQPVTLATLQAESRSSRHIRIAKLDIAGYEATDILRFVEPGGRQFVYVPGEVDAFQVFDTPDDLQWWLMTHTNEIANRARFMSHFPLVMHAEKDHATGLNHALDMMFSNWGPGTLKVINLNDQTVAGDPFSHVRDCTRSRMQADADHALHSNGELRKQMWMGYLRAFGQTFGALAALDWPIALAAVGAGLADVGLNIDQAIHGHTTAERKRGVTGAILGSIDVLFNSVFLLQAAAPEVSEIPSEPESVSESEPTPEDLPAVTSPPALDANATRPTHTTSLPVADGELLSFRTNELLDTLTPPPTEGRMQGVYLKSTGETFISVNDEAYRVRFVNELNTWVIIDPQAPFSFQRNLPVRLNASGTWQPIKNPGLLGGGKTLSTLRSGQASVFPSPPPPSTPYDMPVTLRQGMRTRVESPSNKPFEGYYATLDANDPIERFFVIRDQLASDADAFYARLELPPRPSIPEIPQDALPKTAIRQLYENHQGLVIGESHSSVASKQFLMDNMPRLAKQNVRTLYLEHVLTDLHQVELDTFARTGRMPKTLQTYLEDLDWGHFTDSTGTYTFQNLVRTAIKYRIRIRAIDCMASYRVAGLPDPGRTVRLKLMNYFAHTVIAADESARAGSKWIALVGNAHANTFKGVPGVAEIERVVGLRVRDVPTGGMTGFGIDPGEDVLTAMGQPAGRVKSDLRLQMATTGVRTHFLRTPTSLGYRLRRPGNFAIQRSGDSPQLIYKNQDGEITYVPIRVTDEHLSISSPDWPLISGRRYASFEELAFALKLAGLT
ncbi:membrane-targeted effector domain-containing toxin [Pseudomonas sp. NPDC088368]|uniref:membrane-targeted effector domain-containing toxin n=1 Tax=Pseudomonas sp. NPDC088368 TaxID=3364453 RepID=UPI003828AA45